MSLFGYSPELDYTALTRDGLGRHVNRADPEHSLLLLKPSMRTRHQGGRRFGEDSWSYQVIRAWIAQGAKQRRGDGAIKRLDIQPREHRFAGPGESMALRVIAEFADGSREDVTPFCLFRAKDDYIAEAAPDGLVRGLHRGDTAIIIAYGGNLATARVPGAGPRRARFRLSERPRKQFHRPRGLRQTPQAQHRSIRLGRRRRVPAPRHSRYHRHFAGAAGSARLPRRHPARQA